MARIFLERPTRAAAHASQREPGVPPCGLHARAPQGPPGSRPGVHRVLMQSNIKMAHLMPTWRHMIFVNADCACACLRPRGTRIRTRANHFCGPTICFRRQFLIIWCQQATSRITDSNLTLQVSSQACTPSID